MGEAKFLGAGPRGSNPRELVRPLKVENSDITEKVMGTEESGLREDVGQKEDGERMDMMSSGNSRNSTVPATIAANKRDKTGRKGKIQDNGENNGQKR